MLFYQRDGFAKTAQYAGAAWADAAAHTGKCYLYSDTTKTLNQDLHGGWWDAGDFNKYTNWGASDVIELMHAYAETPGRIHRRHQHPRVRQRRRRSARRGEVGARLARPHAAEQRLGPQHRR